MNREQQKIGESMGLSENLKLGDSTPPATPVESPDENWFQRQARLAARDVQLLPPWLRSHPPEPTPEPPTASKCGCGHPDCVLCYFDNKPRTVAAKHYEQPEESQAADASEASREQHEAQSRRWPDRVSSEQPAVSDAARTEEAEAGGTAPSAGAMVTPSVEPAPPAPDAQVCVWREIETAPKDGTEVLLLGPDGSIDFGHWRADRKYAAGGVWRMRQWLYVFPDAVAWSPTPPVVGTAPQGGEQ